LSLSAAAGFEETATNVGVHAVASSPPRLARLRTLCHSIADTRGCLRVQPEHESAGARGHRALSSPKTTAATKSLSGCREELPARSPEAIGRAVRRNRMSCCISIEPLPGSAKHEWGLAWRCRRQACTAPTSIQSYLDASVISRYSHVASCKGWSNAHP
jgi:hypothetical protein